MGYVIFILYNTHPRPSATLLTLRVLSQMMSSGEKKVYCRPVEDGGDWGNPIPFPVIGKEYSVTKKN